MIRFGLVALSLCLALSLSGCKQAVGDRCQVNSDCEDDLICVLPVGGTPQSGGQCQTTNSQDLGSSNDFSAPVDLSPAD